MQWATNHAIQDESSYQVEGSTFRNYDQKGHGTVSMYDAIRQSFNIPALKHGKQHVLKLVTMHRRNLHQKLDLITRMKLVRLKY